MSHWIVTKSVYQSRLWFLLVAIFQASKAELSHLYFGRLCHMTKATGKYRRSNSVVKNFIPCAREMKQRFIRLCPHSAGKIWKSNCFFSTIRPSLIRHKETAFSKTLFSPEEFKGAQSRLKSLAKLFKFVVCNPCQSSPSLFLYGLLLSLWCFSIFTKCYF